tara:strand:- start:109 stop:486 length:378 start_codon:yes stop_codon:yes gene_type:complete
MGQNMNRPKLKLNLGKHEGVFVKRLLPMVNLVAPRSDRDLAINLLGFHTPNQYAHAYIKDRRWGDMLAIIIFLFLLDDYSERKEFFNLITFNDKFLENRLSQLCGFDEEGMSVEELDYLWNLDYE